MKPTKIKLSTAQPSVLVSSLPDGAVRQQLGRCESRIKRLPAREYTRDQLPSLCSDGLKLWNGHILNACVWHWLS